MSLSLSTISDGTTADATDVNQYKTAIETLAGAGWDDGAGDLDVEELSDAVKTPGDGLDYSGGNLVVDASDFAGTGLEDDGANNLRIAAAAAGDGLQGGAGSALAVDVSDFAGTGLEDDGSENLRIAAAAAGNGLTGGAGSALAVNVDNSTIEINADAVRVKAAGIGSSHLANGAVSEQAKVNLSDAAAINGDAVRYQEFTLEHDASGAHTNMQVKATIYADFTQGGGNGVAAPAATEYVFTNPGTTGSHTEAKIRFPYVNTGGDIDTLYVECEARHDNAALPGSAVAKIQLVADALNAESNAVAFTDYRRHSFNLDVSSHSAGIYECVINLLWTNSLENSDTTNLYLRNVVVKELAALE